MQTNFYRPISTTKKLKRKAQIPCTIIGGIIGGGSVLWIAYSLVSMLLAMVPIGPWAGLIKIAIILFSLVAFGGVTISATVLCGIGLAFLVLYLMD